ncbi:sensor histidine kinase [Microbacterium lacticum]
MSSDNATLSMPVRGSTRGFLAARPLLVDAAVAAGYVLVLLPGLLHGLVFGAGTGWQGWVGLAATLATGVALLFRRRTPLPVLAVVLVLVLVVKTLVCGILDPLGLALAGYAAGAHLPPRRAWVVLPTAVVLVVLVAVIGQPLSAAALDLDVILILNLVLFIPACLVGLLVRVRADLRESERQRLAQEQHEREQAVELTAVRERTTLSREMHDVVGHTLTAIINISDGAMRVAATRPEASQESLRRINQLARDALGETRTILGTLRPDGESALRAPAQAPAPPRTEPTGEAPQDTDLGLRELLDTAESTGLATRLTIHGEPSPGALTDQVRGVVYRIVQEAITNTMRHAKDATTITVTIGHGPDGLTVQTHDDGTEATHATSVGSGLHGASERAAVVGGELHAGPAPGGGWHVTVTVPLQAVAS